MRPFLLLGLGLLLAGCAVGPNYGRPTIDTPAVYRGEGSSGPARPGARSLGEEEWSEVFQDPVLQRLIRTALRQNYDVRIAATRVLQAQAELGITRGSQFPSLAAGATLFTERNPPISSTIPASRADAGEVDLSVVWDLDFWGKYRRETEAARANVLASQWGRRAVLSSVVSSVAAAYFQLRELDSALQISRSTLASRQSSLGLIKVLEDHGSASMLDVRQAEELVYTAGATIADLERQVAQQENALSALLGNYPGAVPRGRELTEQPNPRTVPAGLPSALLERRPDIRQAEENLVAANARIGVAKAALFPSLPLTATGGFESSALNALFTSPAELWNAAASLTQPVFAGGSLRSGLRLAEAQKQEMLLSYRQTIMNAFREVSDALVAFRKGQELREQQEHLTASAHDAADLSKLLYEHGGASYLQVLTSQTNYFAAELDLARARLDERLALVQLYNALGGGWGEQPSAGSARRTAR